MEVILLERVAKLGQMGETVRVKDGFARNYLLPRGKALRATAVNRTGARLVGIRPAYTGTLAYVLASILAGISGILISPVTTIFYDSGFLFGLRAFVGAIIGAMVNYPVTALGALLVGVLESFASFWSSAFKEVIVFSLLLPVLLWRSLSVGEVEDEAEE